MPPRRLLGLFFLLTTLFATSATAQRTVYPNARTGGNYMHNFYLPPAASTPWRPSFSPDGEEIAFSMSGSIWKIKIGEDLAYELTANSTYDSSPVWSPDGRWIVYTADDNYNNINLRLLNIVTGESTALTEGNHVHLDPVWTPDGSRVLYVSTNPGGWYNLYAMPLDNGAAGAPVLLTPDNQFHNERLYFGATDLHIQPTISPDGKEMILVSNRDISLGSGSDLASSDRAERHVESQADLAGRDPLPHSASMVP